MKQKVTSRPPTPRRVPRRIPIRRTTLQARAAASEEEIDDYEGESEPNMRLSHAFIVVLVLHVLAVGGVFAFNSLKTRPSTAERAPKAASAIQPEPKVETSTAKASPPAAPAAEKAAASQKPAPVTEAISYTVVAGDTLTRIASSHKTTVDAIERANEIASGSTIHVGQVLRIPSADVPKVTTTDTKVAMVAAKPVDAAKVAAAKPSTAAGASAAEKKAPAVAKAAPAPAAPAAKAAPVKEVAKVAAPPAASKDAPASAAKAPAAEAKPSPVAATKIASGGTYVVAKGDNPYTIAKKLKVSYSELLKVNKIEDPTKLQIGQKLTVP